MNEKKCITQRTVATNIRCVLAEKGLIHRTVAERAELTPQQFCDILNGRKVIRVEHIAAITDALGVEVNDLFKTGKSRG